MINKTNFINSTELAYEIFRSIEFLSADYRLDLIKSKSLEVQHTIRSTLDELEKHFNKDSKDSRTKELWGNVRKELTNIESLYLSIDKPFSIFIVGNGKYGKTTLLNSLIGYEIAETDVLPLTWKIDVYQSSNSETDTLIRCKDGSSRKMSQQEAIALLENEEIKAHESKKKAEKEFAEERLNYEGNKKAIRELESAIKKKYMYFSDIVDVTWYVKSSNLTKDFQIVDTPGLNQELLSGELKPAFDEYYSKADGVLWMIDATKISARNTFETINNFKGTTNKNVIAIVNRIDKIGKINDDRVKRVLNQAEEIYSNKFMKILPMSALYALEGIKNQDSEKLEESGYNMLVKEIYNIFMKNGSDIRYNRKIEGLEEYTNKVKNHTYEYRLKLNKDIGKIKSSKENYIKDVNNTVRVMDKYINNKINAYRESVLRNINSSGERIFDFPNNDQKVIKRFLNTEIYDENKLDNTIKEIKIMIEHNYTKLYQKWEIQARLKEFEHIEFNTHKQLDSDFTLTSANNRITNTISRENILMKPIGSILEFFNGGGFMSDFVRITAKLVKGKKIKNSMEDNLSCIIDATLFEIDTYANDILHKVDDRVFDIMYQSFNRLYHNYTDNQNVIKCIGKITDMEDLKLEDIRLEDIIGGDEYEFKFN